MNRYAWVTHAATQLSMLDMRRRAISLLVKHVVHLEEPRAKSSMLLHIGMLHLELGEEQEASRYFIEGLTIVEAMELEYSLQFLTILRVIQRQETAVVTDYWLQNSTGRIENHPKFKRTIAGLAVDRM
ncbi:hypothetical protein QK289_08945 [Exiguobacterium antarcticum]|uniref:Tetratricopeptide repeat protein n=1 Tax=Exiguobacterium antarcticum TaxID=132920 RepID=A0ABT6R2G8_9BACL|nr:hypothetical protein [Exiguobacterium antarcticum]MDI3235130.1 hypothetical protein [Exiguobacterium antarcticum]